MSGGSYDYAYYKIQEFAESIRDQETNPKRAAFSKLLLLCSQAAQAIEWVDSCDFGPSDEIGPIDKVFESVSNEHSWKILAYDEVMETLGKIYKGGNYSQVDRS